MEQTLPRLKWPLYLIAIGLIVIPFLDFATSILPLQPYDIRWRFATVALFSGFLFTPLLAITLIVLIASLTEDRVTQRVLSIFNLAFTVLLIVLMSAVRAFAKYVFTILVLLYLGIVGFKVSRVRRSSRDSRRGESTPLVSSQG
jgi:hypothetical protein